MENMLLRMKYIRQMVGYYFLLMLCQIVGEVVVAITLGGIPLGADSETIARMMVDVLASHTYAILAVSYLLLGVILLFKRLKAKTDLVVIDGLGSKVKAGNMLWGVLMGIGGCVWASVVVELLPRHISALQKLTAGETIANADPLWLEFAAVVLMSSFFEELVFRGIIFSRARLMASPTAAVIIQAMIFTSMYSGTVNMCYAFVMGVLLGYAALRAKSVWAPIIIRVAFNAATMAANRFYSAIFSGKEATVAVLIISGIVFIISGFFYFRADRYSLDGRG